MWAYACDSILPVCIVTLGTMLLISSFFSLFLTCSGLPACCSFEGHYLKNYCVTVYGSISTLFSLFSFKRHRPFRYTRDFPFPLPGVATIFAKLRSETAKSLKIGEKVCAHHFVWEIWKHFQRSSLGRDHRCASTYILPLVAIWRWQQLSKFV